MSETPEQMMYHGPFSVWRTARDSYRIEGFTDGVTSLRSPIPAGEVARMLNTLAAKVAEQQREINALCDGLRNEVQRCQSTYAAQAEEREKFKAAEVKVAEQAAEIERLTKQLDAVCAIGDAEVENANINRRALNGTRERMARYRKQRDVLRAQLRAVEALCMSSIATNATLIPSDAQEGGNFDGEDAMAHRVLAILEAKG